MLSWFNATEFQRFGEELITLFMEGKPAADESNRKISMELVIHFR